MEQSQSSLPDLIGISSNFLFPIVFVQKGTGINFKTNKLSPIFVEDKTLSKVIGINGYSIDSLVPVEDVNSNIFWRVNLSSKINGLSFFFIDEEYVKTATELFRGFIYDFKFPFELVRVNGVLTAKQLLSNSIYLNINSIGNVFNRRYYDGKSQTNFTQFIMKDSSSFLTNFSQ